MLNSPFSNKQVDEFYSKYENKTFTELNELYKQIQPNGFFGFLKYTNRSYISKIIAIEKLMEEKKGPSVKVVTTAEVQRNEISMNAVKYLNSNFK